MLAAAQGWWRCRLWRPLSTARTPPSSGQTPPPPPPPPPAFCTRLLSSARHSGRLHSWMSNGRHSEEQGAIDTDAATETALGSSIRLPGSAAPLAPSFPPTAPPVFRSRQTARPQHPDAHPPCGCATARRWIRSSRQVLTGCECMRNVCGGGRGVRWWWGGAWGCVGGVGWVGGGFYSRRCTRSGCRTAGGGSGWAGSIPPPAPCASPISRCPSCPPPPASLAALIPLPSPPRPLVPTASPHSTSCLPACLPICLCLPACLLAWPLLGRILEDRRRDRQAGRQADRHADKRAG
jgi:hypothetical protein